jgi:hypothetical protein
MINIFILETSIKILKFAQKQKIIEQMQILDKTPEAEIDMKAVITSFSV